MLTSALSRIPANDTTAAHDPEAVIRHRGEHSDHRRTSAEIAACLRADIKAAQKAGGLPTMKVSITSDRYSMGQSVTVVIRAASFPVLNPARVAWENAGEPGAAVDAPHWHTPRARQVESRIEAMAAEYVRSETHYASDLHNCNCYITVRYDSDITNAERAAINAK